MKKYILITFSLCIFIVNSCASDIDEFSQLRLKIFESYLENPSDSIVSGYISNMNDDGSYCDINYSSISRAYWEPLEHLERMFQLTCAYTNKYNSYYTDENVYNCIVRGMQYYFDRHPISENWYQSRIAEPNLYGKILINMCCSTKELPLELTDSIEKRWELNGGNPKNESSANRTDVALCRLLLSVLREDSEMLQDALYYIYEPVSYSTSKVGFQEDNSYTYHGRQIYIGAYSEVVLSNVLQVAKWMKSTEYEMPREKVNLLSNYVRNTFSGVIRGQTMNFNCLGRALSRPDYLKKTDIRSSFMRQMGIIDESHASEYKSIAQRLEGTKPSSYNIDPKNTYYYISDYIQHSRSGWSVGLRMVSDRTARVEYLNNENILGYYLSDGSTCITQSGEEYYNIMPLWDYNHIPGVTSPILESIPLAEKTGEVIGYSNFVGAVSDSIYGAAVYCYSDDYKGINTSAKKGYFFLDTEIICMGSSIKGPHDTHTTVDQSWAASDHEILYGEGRNIKGVVHNKMGYYFPKGGNVEICKSNKYGSWYRINNNMSDSTILGNVFLLYLNHHIPDQKKSIYDNTYEYVVVPGVDKSQMINYIENRNIYLFNTDSVQAVVDKDSDVLQVIFYNASTFSNNNNLKISVSKPCICMVRNCNSEIISLHVSDPLRDQQDFEVKVEVGGKTIPVSIAYDVDSLYKGETMRFDLSPSTSSTTSQYDDISKSIIKTSNGYVEIVLNTRENGFIYSLNGARRLRLRNGCHRVHLPNGIYFVEITRPSGKAVYKVIL